LFGYVGFEGFTERWHYEVGWRQINKIIIEFRHRYIIVKHQIDSKKDTSLYLQNSEHVRVNCPPFDKKNPNETYIV